MPTLDWLTRDAVFKTLDVVPHAPIQPWLRKAVVAHPFDFVSEVGENGESLREQLNTILGN